MSSPIKVASLGRFAQAALGTRTARVIAVFERSAYVETPAGLACLGAVGRGPLNAQCDALPPGLKVGDSISVDLQDAQVWRPRAAPAANVAGVSAGLRKLRVASLSRLPEEGFAYLIDPARSRPAPVEALAAWLAHPRAEPAAGALIGLGPGLTPSGDDLLGGAMCALHAVGNAGVATRLGSWALPLARALTSRISYAHLACAAEGECGEAVNDAIVALVSGEAPDLDRIDAIGHTSGWDALAGVALALHAFADTRLT
jgi:hypothetical protein